MHSRNISCKVGDGKACGRAACWSTLENTKTTNGMTAIRADELPLTSWPVYPSWLWRLLPEHLKPRRRCGLRVSHLPAVNQHVSGEARQSHKAAYVTFPVHKNQAQQRSQTSLFTQWIKKNVTSDVNTEERRVKEAAQRVLYNFKKSTRLSQSGAWIKSFLLKVISICLSTYLFVYLAVVCQIIKI